MKTIRYFLLPIAVFSLITWTMAHVKSWSFESQMMQEAFTDTSFVKFILTIVIPFILIMMVRGLKSRSGIYFGSAKNSLHLAWTSFYLVGPAFIGFFIINIFGWTIKDWYGSLVLTILFSTALLFIPRITKDLPIYREVEKKNTYAFVVLIFLSFITVLLSTLLHLQDSIFFRFLYYFSIVAVGEELLFRGYILSSFNVYFGKPFAIANVEFG